MTAGVPWSRKTNQLTEREALALGQHRVGSGWYADVDRGKEHRVVGTVLSEKLREMAIGQKAVILLRSPMQMGLKNERIASANASLTSALFRLVSANHVEVEEVPLKPDTHRSETDHITAYVVKLIKALPTAKPVD